MLAAQTKLMAALPASLRSNAGRMQQRFHLDAPSWFGEAEQPKHLRAIAGAVLRENPIEIRYQSWRAEKRRRVAPLGLVLKGGSWYLAGQVDGSVRTYRVARVLDCNILDDRFTRPTGFDLAAHWQAATTRLEAEMHPNLAIVRLSPFGIKLLNALSQDYVKSRTRIEDTAEEDGSAHRARADRKDGVARSRRTAAISARRRKCSRRPNCETRWPNSRRPWRHATGRRNMVTGMQKMSADPAPRNSPETRYSPPRVNARRGRSD